MSTVYAPVGQWWTPDAPSLRLPTRDGDRVSIWTVGDGPSLLLVPRPGEDRRAWLPLLPCMQDRFTLHASSGPGPTGPRPPPGTSPWPSRGSACAGWSGRRRCDGGAAGAAGRRRGRVPRRLADLLDG